MRDLSKGYITGWKDREKPEERHIVDVWFDHRPEKAACWPTREQAENDCVIFSHWQIVIPSADGGTHICKGFKVEKRAPGEFVVFCEAPFILKASGESTASSQSDKTPRFPPVPGSEKSGS